MREGVAYGGETSPSRGISPHNKYHQGAVVHLGRQEDMLENDIGVGPKLVLNEPTHLVQLR